MLDRDPTLLAGHQVEQFYDEPAPAAEVVAGGTVRIVGRPGDWEDGSPVPIWAYLNNGPSSVNLPDATLSDDRSTVTFTLPRDVSLPATGTYGISITVLNYGTDAEGIEQVRNVYWSGRLRVAPLAVSETSASPALPIGLSSRRTTATASVTTADGGPSVGTVTFLVNTREVSTVPLVDGRAKTTLPRLPRGLYFVTAVYSGDDGIAGSTSTRTPLRIIY